MFGPKEGFKIYHRNIQGTGTTCEICEITMQVSLDSVQNLNRENHDPRANYVVLRGLQV